LIGSARAAWCRLTRPGDPNLRYQQQSYKDGELRMAGGIAVFRTVIEDVKIFKGADQADR